MSDKDPQQVAIEGDINHLLDFSMQAARVQPEQQAAVKPVLEALYEQHSIKDEEFAKVWNNRAVVAQPVYEHAHKFVNSEPVRSVLRNLGVHVEQPRDEGEPDSYEAVHMSDARFREYQRKQAAKARGERVKW